MVYEQITVLPRRHGGCMGRRDRNATAFHPWFPADAAMTIDDDVNGPWSPVFDRLPLAHLIRRMPANPEGLFQKRMCLQESKMWRHVVHCGNAYTPDEFQLKFEDGTLVVSARHERVSPDGSSKDVQEITRNIKVPDDIDTDSIKCVRRENGDLVIYAHRHNETAKESEAKPENNGNKDTNTEETLLLESNMQRSTESNAQSNTQRNTESNRESNTAEETSEKSAESVSLAETKTGTNVAVVNDTALVNSKPFSIDIPISGFEPSEVTVICRGRTITMSGEKTEESDHGKTYQKWRRQILLPPNVDIEKLNCRLSQDGKLRLCARKPISEQSGPLEERDVPVLVEEHSDEKEAKRCEEMEH